MKLKDKVVVVTGSTRGIGRAIAEGCAKEGAKVVICSRHAASVQEMCEVLKRQGLSVSGLCCRCLIWQERGDPGASKGGTSTDNPTPKRLQPGPQGAC